MKKEYGGYLPIELPKGTPYYHGAHVIPLNAGRYAIVYAIQEAGWERICLPYYICATVEEAIRRYLPDLCIRYYHIDENFLPVSVALEEKEGILWVNYFGIQPEEVIGRIVREFYGHLIIDHTQSFFTSPRKGAYQVYSCRKFFGVCDGSYVIHENISKRELPPSCSSPYGAHLLYSLEYGTNYSYGLNKENEERLGQCGMSAMSPLTAAILGAVNYAGVRQKRTENMETLHRILNPWNQLSMEGPAPAMSYPFLCEKAGLREQLVGHKVYVPKLWEETARNGQASSWEKYLSENLCALPIDQRYTREDMNEIGSLVTRILDSSQ